MKENINANEIDENENKNFIFYVDNNKKNSQGYIKFDLSDLPDLKNKHYGVFSLQKEKNGSFDSWDDFDIGDKDVSEPIELEQMSYDNYENSNKDENSNKVPVSSKYVYGARFCFSNKKIKNENANNLSFDGENLVWLEVKVEKNGDKLLYKYDAKNKKWTQTNFKFQTLDLYDNGNTDAKNQNWETWPRDDKALMRFGRMDCISLQKNSLQKNSEDIFWESQYSIGRMLEKNGISYINPNLKVYACVQLEDGGAFYLNNCTYATSATSATLSDFLDNLKVYNYINGAKKDVYAVRFYVTEKNLNVKHGEKFDEYLLKDREMSVFEIKKDNYNVMVPYSYDFHEKKWLPVHATVECKNGVDETDVNSKREFKESHQYICSVKDDSNEENNMQSLSYSIEHCYMGKNENDYKLLGKKDNTKPDLNETEFFKSMSIFETAVWFVKRNLLKILFCTIGATVSGFLWSWIPVVYFVVLFAILLFFDKRIDVPGIGEFSFKEQNGKPYVANEREDLINIVDNEQPEQNANRNINNNQHNIVNMQGINNGMLRIGIQASLHDQQNQNQPPQGQEGDDVNLQRAIEESLKDY